LAVVLPLGTAQIVPKCPSFQQQFQWECTAQNPLYIDKTCDLFYIEEVPSL